MKISEKKTKENLEKLTGIEFDYTEAIYDTDIKQYRFKIKMPSKIIAQRFRNVDGINVDSNIFIVSKPDDFEPYKTLADFLDISFFEVFNYIFYDYGIDWEIGTGQGENIYCWTGKGWLNINEVEKTFIAKFSKQRKNVLLENEEWIIKIYKNYCCGINYKKSNKGEWATAYECRLSYDELQDKLIQSGIQRINKPHEEKAYILSKAQRDFDYIQKLVCTEIEKVDLCYEILDKCKDFEPASKFIENASVPMPENVMVTENDKTNSLIIRWERVPGREISYRVIRKQGKDLPKNAYDGDELIDNITNDYFIDNAPPIGEYFSYGVCTKRNTKLSLPALSPIIKPILPEVANEKYYLTGNTVHITWTMHEKCIGATVSSSDKNILEENNVQGFFSYNNLIFGQKYEYIIKANYPGGLQSAGKEISFTPREEITSFDIEIKKEKSDKYRISWNISVKNAIIKIIINNEEKDQVISGLGYYDIILPANEEYEIKAIAASGTHDPVESPAKLVSTKKLTLNCEYFLLPQKRSSKTKTRIVSVVLDSSNYKYAMIKRPCMILCAFDKNKGKLPDFPNKMRPDAIELEIIPEDFHPSPCEKYNFDIKIDPSNPRLMGKQLGDYWDLALFCIDDDYKCITVKRAK